MRLRVHACHGAPWPAAEPGGEAKCRCHAASRNARAPASPRPPSASEMIRETSPRQSSSIGDSEDQWRAPSSFAPSAVRSRQGTGTGAGLPMGAARDKGAYDDDENFVVRLALRAWCFSSRLLPRPAGWHLGSATHWQAAASAASAADARSLQGALPPRPPAGLPTAAAAAGAAWALVCHLSRFAGRRS